MTITRDVPREMRVSKSGAIVALFLNPDGSYDASIFGKRSTMTYRGGYTDAARVFVRWSYL